MALTQSVGMAAFAVAAVACVARKPIALAPGVIFALAAVEAQAGLRYTLHYAVSDAIIRAAAPIADKTQVQIAMLIVVALLAPLVAILVLRGGGWARIAAFALIALTAVETVSLHAIDAILLMPVGPIMLIGWLWVVIALVTTVARIAAPERSR